MSEASFEQVEALVRRTYERIWADWYASFPDARPATLAVENSDRSGGYSPSRDLLLVAVPEGNLEDFHILNARGWPIWKVELVHEMLHEFQSKRVDAPTPEGVALCARFRRRFSGGGHDDLFFTAVADRASYFGTSPEELIDRL